MADPIVTTTTRDWREIVEKVDGPDRHRDSLYPIVYTFGGGLRRFRDSGPQSGVYEPAE